MSKNSERFINSFNRIEEMLNKKIGSSEYITFKNKVEQLSQTKDGAAIRRYRVDLLEFAELRNAIVHQRTKPEFVIAEPHDSTVEKIETIEERITKPRTVIPEFARNVQSFQITDPLSYVLEFIDEQQYSQFPIYNGEAFEGLLTTNGITNWLASNIEEDIISIRDAKIEDVLPFEEYKSNYKFISRDTNIFEAEELFKNNLDEGERLEAVFITHSGKQSEKLLGIITSWDIIDIPKV